MPTFAAIDIGSNSCRLAIASVQQHRLKTLFEDREVTRLGESVFETGVISPEAMANTIKTLKRFQKSVQAQVVDKVRVVATSAVRDARNSEAFRAWVKSATGWTVEVISGLEEGRLIHLGIVTHEPGAQGKCLLIDLGGGSCEVTISDHGRIQQMVSLPLGAVRLQAEFLRTDPPTQGRCGAAAEVYRPRAGEGGAEAGTAEGGAGDCDFGNSGGAGGGEQCAGAGAGEEECARRRLGDARRRRSR